MNDEPEDWNFNAGISAVMNAESGNWTLLRERLRDPAVILTGPEREFLANQGPGSGGRPKQAPEPLLYWWFRQAEGLGRKEAIARVCQAVGRDTATAVKSVEKSIQRAGGDDFDPGPIWQRNAAWYRDGNRHPIIFPPEIAPQVPDPTAYFRRTTE